MKISYENLEFSCEIKTKIFKKIHTSKINVDFKCGRKIILGNTNLGLEEPNKIIFSNSTKYFEIVVYEDDDKFYSGDLSSPISLNKLTEIVNDMK